MIGETVSHYRIREAIGSGGMGLVYRAEDERLGRPVALKFLPAHLGADAAARDRFLNEARAASALDHPNVCVVHEIDELPTGEIFIAMAFYDGETVEQRIGDGPLPIEDAVGLGCQIAEGLSAAHLAGIVHRDVKPANLMVTWDGIVKILDFGIAKLSSAFGHRSRTGPVGTVAYAAPEQLDTGEATPRSDVWSLGVVLYEMLTGRLPFEGKTPIALLHNVLLGEPRPIREVRPEVPAPLAVAVETALSKDPATRPSDAAAFLALLQESSGSTTPLRDGISRGSVRDSGSLTLVPPFLHPGVEDEEATGEPFVGREEELERLASWLREASTGRGRVAFVRGEAGSGKTALLREFSLRAALEDPELTVAIGQCNAHTGPGDPYRPFREILGQLTGDVEAQWAGGGLSSLHAARLWGLLPDAFQGLVDAGPHLTSTFLSDSGLLEHGHAHGGVPDEVLARLEALDEGGDGHADAGPTDQADLCQEYVRVLRSLARDRTLLLVVDDLQWVDTASVQLLFEVTRHLGGARLMVVGLYRTSEVGIGRDGGRHPLEPLLNDVTSRLGDVTIDFGVAEGRSFVDAVVDAEPNRLGDDFRSALVRQAGGNALFTVELYRSLRDSGVVGKDEEGRWSLEEGPVDWQHLPARVEAVVAERLGRLAPDLRRLLSLASVEGERFTLEVLAGMEAADPRDLLPAVNRELQKRHRLVVPDGLRRVDGHRVSTYRFRHVLFQRHLYEGLDEAEKAYAHEKVAEILESLHGDRADQIALPLAHHYRQAGRTEEACEWFRTAGEAALGSMAHQEALAHFETALRLTLALPASTERDGRERVFQTLVGETRLVVGAPGVEDAFQRALELANAVGTPEEIFRATGGLYTWQHYAGFWKTPMELGENCLSIARREGDRRLLAAGLAYAAHAAHYAADHAQTAAYAGELLSFYDPARHGSDFFFGIRGIGASACLLLGNALIRQGHIDRGLSLHGRAESMAPDLDERLTRHIVHFSSARELIWLEDFVAARKHLEACIALQEATGAYGFYLKLPHLLRGWCDLHLGDPEGGLAQIEDGLANWPFPALRSRLLAERGVALTRCGRPLGCLSELAGSMEVPQENMPLFRGRVHRLYGDLLSSLPNPDLEQAEEAYREAIRFCEGHGDLVDGLAASIALAELLADTRRHEEGHAALQKAYDAFPEGQSAPLLERAEVALSGGASNSLPT